MGGIVVRNRCLSAAVSPLSLSPTFFGHYISACGKSPYVQ